MMAKFDKKFIKNLAEKVLEICEKSRKEEVKQAQKNYLEFCNGKKSIFVKLFGYENVDYRIKKNKLEMEIRVKKELYGNQIRFINTLLRCIDYVVDDYIWLSQEGLENLGLFGKKDDE